MRHASLAAIAAVLVAGALSAQPNITPGTRVRVYGTTNAFPDNTHPRIGVAVSASRDALVIRPERSRDTLSMRYADLTRVDVSQGRKSHKLAGAIVGGLLTGAGFVSLACAMSNGSCDIGQDIGGFLAYYAVGAIPGVLVGTFVGARIRGPERWRSVWPGPTTAISLRFGASLQVR